MMAGTAGRLVTWTPARLVKLALVLAVLVGLPVFAHSPLITTVFISALMFGIFGAIYDLMIGYAGLTNFGYAAFIAVGAYASGLADVRYGISPWFGLGIGVSTGPVAAALLGSEERLEYTLVGDTVNLAQRLQDLARPGGCLVFGEATREALPAPPPPRPAAGAA